MVKEETTRRLIDEAGNVLSADAGERQLYKLSELSQSAHGKAFDRWCQSQWEDPELIDNDCAIEVVQMLGVTLSTREVKLMNGGRRREPVLHYNIGGGRGDDGASFAGTYEYVPGTAKKIKAEFPENEKLNELAGKFQDLQRRHFYKLTASITEGRDAHPSSMQVTTYRNYDEVEGDVANEMQDLIRDVAWLAFNMLRDECDYRTSSELFEQENTENEWLYDEHGKWVQ